MATLTMRNLTEHVTIELVTEDCYNCGVTFAMPRSFKEQRLTDKALFYCPAGHGQQYIGKSEAQKERELREQAERRLAAEQGWSAKLSGDLEAERKRHASTKGQLTKTRKRVQAGVCPVDGCRRHFANLERHMAKQHPADANGMLPA